MTVQRRLVNQSTGKGRVCLITGAASGSGMGTEMAVLFANHGARVVVTDLEGADGYNRMEAHKLVARIKSMGIGDAIWHPLDVTKEDQWEKCIAAVEKEWGPIDVLVNNAGIGGDHGVPLEEKTYEEWRSRILVNLDAPFLGTKHVIRSMKKRTATETASIVNISSVAGLIGYPSAPAYGAAKAGLRLFTKSTALYCAEKKYNIRANSVHPGVIVTPMTIRTPGRSYEIVKQWGAEITPLGHAGKPDDIANMCLFLASEESSFCTGAEFVVDGGWTAK